VVVAVAVRVGVAPGAVAVPVGGTVVAVAVGGTVVAVGVTVGVVPVVLDVGVGVAPVVAGWSAIINPTPLVGAIEKVAASFPVDPEAESAPLATKFLFHEVGSW
jgi:hypothetical protein